MFRSLLLAFTFIISAGAFAQKSTVIGRVFDSTVQKGLPYATLSLVKAKDSTLVTFSRADSSGNFKFNNVDAGDYLVSTSFVGYLPVWKPVSVASGENKNMGFVSMTDVKFATDVTVTAKRPPVTINNDTLEFNTENFKTQPNAVVEDMLKKMPGVTIDADGTVRVNGQIVRKVTVNGKEFFTGDPKMATKNLNADAVDKVQVYDRKSDQSMFTGVDDGNTEKTINLKLKKDRNNALFGKLTAGGGTDGRYDGQTNINQFKGDKQLSFLGMGNNTNKQGFSISDVLNFTGEMSRGMRNGGGITIRTGGGDDNGLPVAGLGQNQQGIAKTFAGGANYNNTWNNRKTDLNTSYTTSDVDLFTERESHIQNLFPGNNYEQISKSSSQRRNKQNRVNAAWDQKIDTFTSFKMTPALQFQETQSVASNNITSRRADGSLINEGYTNTAVKSNAVNFTNNLLFRRRFAKKGRTISANLNLTYNHSESKGDLNSKYTYYTTTPSYDSLLNQKNERDAITRGFGASITYTEPIGKKSLLELSGFYNSNNGESNRVTYDYNGNSGKYDAQNSLLTNNFESNYTYQGGSLNFRSNLAKLNLNAGASVQDAILKGVNHTFKNEQSQHFTDVLPNASVQYSFSRTKNLRMEYRTNTTQPSIQQLQPVPDVSDPLNISRGNASLKRQYDQTFSMNFFSASMERRTNLFAFINYTKSDNAIVTADSLKANGVRISQPVNASGVQNLFGALNFGFPVKALKSNVSIGSNTAMFKNVSFLNGARNEITNWSFGPNMNWNFSIDNKIDLQLTARYNYNNVKYSLQPQLNNDYWQQTYTTDMTNYLPFGIVVNNQLNYVINTGRADGFNTSVPLWNASVSKGFFKNKRAELKLSGFDLLNRNVGITRSANQNYISDVKYNVLQRYFMMSVTYSLNKSGLGGGPRAVIRTF